MEPAAKSASAPRTARHCRCAHMPAPASPPPPAAKCKHCKPSWEGVACLGHPTHRAAQGRSVTQRQQGSGCRCVRPWAHACVHGFVRSLTPRLSVDAGAQT